MNRQPALVLVASLLSALAGIALYLYLTAPPEFVSASPGKAAASTAQNTQQLRFDDIVLKDLAYRPRHLNEWKKPILIINFWAPWCAPCRREIPALIALQKANDANTQLIGLSFDAVENVANFQQKFGINYPLLLVQSESTPVNQFFGNKSRALPFTAILNARREIVFRHSGEVTQQLLQQKINKIQ